LKIEEYTDEQRQKWGKRMDRALDKGMPEFHKAAYEVFYTQLSAHVDTHENAGIKLKTCYFCEHDEPDADWRETYDLLEQDIHNRNYEYEPPSIEIIRKVIEEYDAKKDAQEKGEGKKGRKKAREIID
jgi:hypothetical protein